MHIIGISNYKFTYGRNRPHAYFYSSQRQKPDDFTYIQTTSAWEAERRNWSEDEPVSLSAFNSHRRLSPLPWFIISVIHQFMSAVHLYNSHITWLLCDKGISIKPTALAVKKNPAPSATVCTWDNTWNAGGSKMTKKKKVDAVVLKIDEGDASKCLPSRWCAWLACSRLL